MSAHDDGHHLLHKFQGICLTLVGGEWRNAYPLLESFLLANLVGEKAQVAAFFGEDGREIEFHGISKLGEHLRVVLEGGGQLRQLLLD